jgi:hypothetical protein
MKNSVLITAFLTVQLLFAKNIYSQKYLIGFSFEPGITQKTTNGSKLKDNPSGDFVFTTSEGFNLNYRGKRQFQAGFTFRYILKDWYLQASLSTLQNYIQLEANGTPIPGGTLRVPIINPGVAVIRRIHLRNGIEFNYQLGITAGFSTAKGFVGIYKTDGWRIETNDTIKYGWSINMNTLRNTPKIAVQSSATLMIPISRNWNCEFGVGFYHELNKPNVVGHSSYYHSSQPNYPFNYNFPFRSYPGFNERYFYLTFGVFREIHVNKRK